MLSSSEERRAALQAQLRTLDDHAARDRKEEQRLRNVACELKSQRERHKQDEKRAEVELRCAVIAARRLGLERIKRRIEDVSVERRRAYLRIQVTETPSDRWKWTDIDDAQRTNVQDRYQQLQTLGVEKQILQQEMDELTAQRAVLEAKRVEQRDLIKRSEKTEAELNFAKAMIEPGRASAPAINIAHSRTAKTEGRENVPPGSTSSNSSNISHGFCDVEQAMCAEAKPEELDTPRSSNDAPAPSNLQTLVLHESSPRDETQHAAQRLARDRDVIVQKLKEHERAVEQHEELAKREAFDVDLFAVAQELVCELVLYESIRVADAACRERDNIVDAIQETLVEGCLGREKPNDFVKAELAHEFAEVVELRSLMMKHRSNPKLDLPLKPARSILEDNYSAPVLREDKMESHLGLSRRSREWQVPGQTLLSFPGQEEVSALATTIFWGTTMLVAAGTCSGSIFVWIVASSKSHGDENTSLMRTSRRQVSTKGSAAICMLNFFGSRLVALDEAGTVNSWDFACSENATIDAVIPIFSLNNIDELVRGQCTTPGNPKRVHHDETMLNSTQVTVAMSQGIVLDLNLTASEQGGSTRRRSRRAHKQSNSAVQYTCSGQQFALDYHDCEVLFLQTMPFDGSRRIVTVDTSGLCAVWPDPQRDSTLDITWHRRKLPVFSARLFPEKEFGKNISCNTYEGTEVFSRHVLRLAETSENHQLAAICALDRFQSTFREFEETGYVFDNERVVAKERSADTTIATKTYVLSIVPAARNCAAFSVLVLARPSSSQEFTEKVAEGDTLKVYTVASIGDGGKCGPSLVKRKDLTVTHHVAVGSGDAGVPFGECVIAILAPHDEDGYLLMRLGEALYVYHSSIEKSGKKGEPSILHTVIVEPSRHRRQELLVAGATESAAMFVCTSADGLVLFDNPLVQPPRRGESDLELVSEGYDVTKRS